MYVSRLVRQKGIMIGISFAGHPSVVGLSRDKQYHCSCVTDSMTRLGMMDAGAHLGESR